jgi:hypothetical protein
VIELTPRQAAAIATIRAVPARNPSETFNGWTRFLGFSGDITPSEYQQHLLADVQAADQVAARLLRLRAHPRLMKAVGVFTLRRAAMIQDEYVEGISPASVLGATPDDRAGQFVLVHELSLHRAVSYTLLAKAFSIPFGEFGERLLMGELIIRDDDQGLHDLAVDATKEL